MEPTVSTETSAIRTQTLGNYPKRNTLHLEHGESLKTSVKDCLYVRICTDWVDGGIDVKLCKSERNWLKYISKEDEEPYFNVAVDKLTFN